MFCDKCGSWVEPSDFVCNVCGNKLYEQNDINDNSVSMSTMAIVFGFFIPLLGWIFGGIGLSRANRFNNERSKTKSIIAIIIATLVFIFNLFYYEDVMEILSSYLQM